MKKEIEVLVKFIDLFRVYSYVKMGDKVQIRQNDLIIECRASDYDYAVKLSTPCAQ